MKSSPFLALLLLLWPAGLLANLIVFGDSYADVGNFQRWTNGPVWSELLALGWNQSLHSFAYSGAVCDNDLFLDNSDRATPSIRDQMEYYYQQQDLAPDAETVFAFSVGVSDIHQAFMEQPVTPDFTMIADCIMEQIAIAQKVFHGNRILLLNLPPMDKMPYFHQDLAIQHAVQVVNEALQQKVDALNANATLDLIDIHTLVTDLIDHPPDGLTNTHQAYWDTCQDCQDPDHHVWWDQTHWTGRIHHAIGNFILQTNSFAPPTSVDKQMIETMDNQSPIYHAQPHATDFLQQLMDQAPNNTISTDTTTNTNQHGWPLFTIVVLGVAVGLWWRNRRTSQHHSLDNDTLLV